MEKYGPTMVQTRKMIQDAAIKYYVARKQAMAEGKCLSTDRRMEHAKEHMQRKPYGRMT